MKNLFLVLAIGALCTLWSCGGGTPSAGEAARLYAEQLADGKYDQFIDGVYIPEEMTPDDLEYFKSLMKITFIQQHDSEIERYGGVASVELISEQLSSDGKGAVVVLKWNYTDGTVKTRADNMTLVGGVWRMGSPSGSMAAMAGWTSPTGEAAKRYAGYLATGEFDKFVDGIQYPEGTSAENIEFTRSTVLGSLAAGDARPYSDKGGISSVDVISEIVAADGKTAEVVLRYNLGNGEISGETMGLVLVGEEWKIKWQE